MPKSSTNSKRTSVKLNHRKGGVPHKKPIQIYRGYPLKLIRTNLCLMRVSLFQWSVLYYMIIDAFIKKCFLYCAFYKSDQCFLEIR